MKMTYAAGYPDDLMFEDKFGRILFKADLDTLSDDERDELDVRIYDNVQIRAL